jgi:hypothetical protein
MTIQPADDLDPLAVQLAGCQCELVHMKQTAFGSTIAVVRLDGEAKSIAFRLQDLQESQ